jgi:acyl carrier protein
MNEDRPPVARRAVIAEWLAVELAAVAEVDYRDVDADAPFDVYGLDSVTAVNLVGKLEEWLGLVLPPTLFWDYPTVATLADHLATFGDRRRHEAVGAS